MKPLAVGSSTCLEEMDVFGVPLGTAPCVRDGRFKLIDDLCPGQEENAALLVIHLRQFHARFVHRDQPVHRRNSIKIWGMVVRAVIHGGRGVVVIIIRTFYALQAGDRSSPSKQA